jgi:hypothetical protein
MTPIERKDWSFISAARSRQVTRKMGKKRKKLSEKKCTRDLVYESSRASLHQRNPPTVRMGEDPTWAGGKHSYIVMLISVESIIEALAEQ